ncbi:uncharacterized protein [Salminus brasiliensis]|uniref:uncharacterized protein n=1 Tax=Salminus brasiliensis TaxID=930266 RepID=UPI003B837967
MGWIQLLLLCSLWSSFICSSVALSVPMPGDLPIHEEDETVETTYKQLCNGIEVELKDCNDRLTAKNTYTLTVEKEVFLLKRQLRQLKIECMGSINAAKMQISALQAQLDSLLKQLGTKTTGPAKEVLVILQKYIDMKKLEVEITVERDDTKITNLEQQLNALKAELNDKSLNLTASKCQAGDSSQMLEISKLQEAIDNLRRGSVDSAQSQRLAELERQLAEKLKKLDGAGGDGGGTSTQVTVIIKDQEDILEIQRRLAVLLKTQTEFSALQDQLKVKKTLLSDLNGKKKKHGTSSTLSERTAVIYLW